MIAEHSRTAAECSPTVAEHYEMTAGYSAATGFRVLNDCGAVRDGRGVPPGDCGVLADPRGAFFNDCGKLRNGGGLIGNDCGVRRKRRGGTQNAGIIRRGHRGVKRHKCRAPKTSLGAPASRRFGSVSVKLAGGTPALPGKFRGNRVDETPAFPAYAGCCWVRQCREPKPQTKSTAWMPTTGRSRKSSPRMPSATRSLGSLKVGTMTAALQI